LARSFVEIIEVSARDGIQNEPVILPTEEKLGLIGRALDAGLRRMEVTSFVNPKRVPQMADAAEVTAGLPRDRGARFIGLTLNRKGFDRAAEAGLDEANFVVVASDTFNQRNQGVPTADSIAAFAAIRADAPPGIAVGLTIGAAFGCPFEGEVPVARLMQVVEACMEHDPFELALADTIGVATPRDVTERVGAVRAAFPDVRLRLHLHNTRNTGIANAWAGIEAGMRSLDASLGGVGGCPFAPRATGNIATEDLVYMLDRSGVDTGVDLDKAIAAAEWLEARLGKTVPGMVMKAGGFPAPRAA
jgi:hydroxymethylglutaryl-CoA lyase